jgi:hypothetical protein
VALCLKEEEAEALNAMRELGSWPTIDGSDFISVSIKDQEAHRRVPSELKPVGGPFWFGGMEFVSGKK